jgi:hypothetical protein
MPGTQTLRRHFGAPWSPKLWTLTLATVVALLIGVVISGSLWFQGLLGSILAGTYAFSPRGYSVVDGQILVHHVGWATRFDLDNLRSVKTAPGVMRGSIRSFGNGGLFGFYGRFRNSTLGSYRAYATNNDNAVVLDVEGTGYVVLTPDAPDAFVEIVRAEQENR